MEVNGWLSVAEMVRYHTGILMWKAVNLKKPLYIYRGLRITDELLIEYQEPRLQFPSRGFKWRASLEWNEIPREIRSNQSVATTKRMLKAWIISRRNREPDYE